MIGDCLALQQLSRLGYAHTSGQTIEEQHAEIAFKFTKLFGNCRLADMQA